MSKMDFLDYVKDSKTAFHAAKTTALMLDEAGFKRINESDAFDIKSGGKYYITRNGSSVIAFVLAEKLEDVSFHITAAHLDSPTFKLKPNFELDVQRYQKFNTEVYGGPIFYTWMDRPLDIAGRVLVRRGNEIRSELISFNKAMCMIPSLSIHYNRDANNGMRFNPQEDMMPIFADNDHQFGDLYGAISAKLGVEREAILGHDLYLALLDRGTYAGADNEFMMAPQIDNLECSFAAATSLINAKVAENTVNVMVLFDSEEIGSRTRAGADSDLLNNILERITMALGKTKEEYYQALAHSFFVSMDNAQGFHPNYPSKYDATNRCMLNDGIVIKSAARGSYTTDGYSEAVFKAICDDAEARYQMMTNRSDMPGGSTLGAINLSHVSLPSVDIGFAQIAMHSAYETAGSLDMEDMQKAITKFYSVHFESLGDGKVKW